MVPRDVLGAPDGGSQQLCRPHGRDWGRGRSGSEPGPLLTQKMAGVHPPWTQGATCLSPSVPLKAVLRCPVNACRHGVTHTGAQAHTWHRSIHHTRQATRARHMQVHAHVYTRVHAACHTCEHTSYTMHTHADARSHMHTSHADTHHTCMHGPRGCLRPLSWFMLPACSGLRSTRQARPCAAATRGPREAGPRISETAKGPKRPGRGRRRREPATRNRTRQ